MNLVVGPDDEEGFLAARDLLLERFERWLTPRLTDPESDPTEAAGDVGSALSWKWSYGDGHLGRWRIDDISEFLLEWCPRKLSVSQADCVPIPAALGAFACFLDDEGLMARGSSPAAAIVKATTEMTDGFVAAMGDPSNFGMAKSLFSAASADGVDFADPQGMQDWIDEFNSRPQEERHQILPDSAQPRPPRPVLPPVAMPDDVEVASSMAAAPVLATFAAFAEFIGGGRKLTKTGNLTLADARALVERLETGDVMDESIGDRTFRTTSSAELPRLRHIFAWARKAGVVRVVHGRVIATKKGLAIARDPAGFFDRSVEALLAIGLLASQRDSDGWFAWPDVNALLDGSVDQLLTGLYVAQQPLPLDGLCAVGSELVLKAFEFRALTDDEVARRIGTDIVDMVDALELAGVVCRADFVEPDANHKWASRRRLGGTVELTAAGVATARRRLVAAGVSAPVAGRFADASATELLLGTDLEDFLVMRGEIEAWRRRRDPAQAAAELAAAVMELEDPLRSLALVLMEEIDLDVAGPEVRRLAAHQGTRGYALCWLVDHGLEEQATLFDPDDAACFVDVLAHRMATTGPEGLCETLTLAGSHEAQIGVVGRMWRSPSMATSFVLAAIADTHPVRLVAKAARKASFQRRSLFGPQ